MTDVKRCVKCQRAIDVISLICPFCNWDQAQPAPSAEALATPSPAAAMYTPPEEFRWKKLLLIAGGIAAMLLGSFGFGMVINRDGAPEKAPETIEEQIAERSTESKVPRRADTPLVPAGQGGIDQTPITSAPVLAPQGNLPDEYQRTDATAVSADEYAQMAQRAQVEKKKQPTTLVDPRTIAGRAYTQAPPAPARRSPQAQASPVPRSAPRVTRTRPIPEYQPLPRVKGQGRARLTLIVGPDGRVSDVNVERSLAGGNTAALIGAVQRWRFKPATENGEPVAAPYTVEISFDRE